MVKLLNVADDAAWKARYRAMSIVWSHVATQNPARGVVCTNRDGIYQLYAWDVETGDLTRRTDQPAGVTQGYISADGEWIYYLHDEQGNEIGHYFRIPFTGGDPQDLTPDMPAYASFYITESHSGNARGFTAANQFGFQMYVQDTATGDQLFSYENPELSVGPILSHDAEIAVIATTERSGSTDFMLEAYDVATGQRLGELYDGDDINVQPGGFVPRSGDERFMATTNKSGFARPLLWNPRTGERQDIPLPQLEGELTAWDWTTDGRYLLLRELHQAEYQLYLYDLETDDLITLQHPDGTYNAGYFVESGNIFVNLQDSTQPSRVIELDGQTGAVVRTVIEAGDVPDGTKWRSVTYASGDGTPIQAWLVTPDDADAPYPTIVHTHGGPTSVMTERFDASAQAWVDHGFAFFSINYRGSITFGKDFENSIRGNLGDYEVQDVAAGAQWLIDEGVAQPDALFKTGGSYGGYLTLQTLGKEPDLWAGGMALVAIADWAAMYEDEAETLRGYQRGLFGGAPEDMPEQYAKSSPITYAENVSADLLVIQGRNDTRCPARQMETYEQTLREMGKPIEVHWFDAGHGSRENEQSIDHQERMMRFVYSVLG